MEYVIDRAVPQVTGLKYQAEIDKLNPNFDKFKELKDIQSFRWVFEDINDARNFCPTYQNDPTRKRTDFRGWAISFFISEKHAKARLLHFLNDKPELHKKLGTHIAEGIVIENDGLGEECDEVGHFDQFEYIGVDFTPRFEIIDKVAGPHE